MSNAYYIATPTFSNVVEFLLVAALKNFFCYSSSATRYRWRGDDSGYTYLRSNIPEGAEETDIFITHQFPRYVDVEKNMAAFPCVTVAKGSPTITSHGLGGYLPHTYEDDTGIVSAFGGQADYDIVLATSSLHSKREVEEIDGLLQWAVQAPPATDFYGLRNSCRGWGMVVNYGKIKPGQVNSKKFFGTDRLYTKELHFNLQFDYAEDTWISLSGVFLTYEGRTYLYFPPHLSSATAYLKTDTTWELVTSEDLKETLWEQYLAERRAGTLTLANMDSIQVTSS